MWPFKKKQIAESVTNDVPQRQSYFAADSIPDDGESVAQRLDERLQAVLDQMPKVSPPSGTTDSCEDTDLVDAELLSQNVQGVSEALFLWYATQGFIGHQLCAILSQHWLINKVCLMPGRDAIRQGYDIKAENGEEIPDEAMRLFKRYDKKFGINKNMVEHIRLGRIFGIRIAFCKIISDDKDFYEKPFNPDGILPGSYRGIVQVDPYWCAPVIDATSTSEPDTIHFYEPTYWIINGKKYHRSHLVIFKTNEMPDILKPSYYYGGMPIPQLIMERVYAAERTANEAPAMALSKRTTVLKTDVAKALANEGKFVAKMKQWMAYWSNWGVKVIDKEDDEIDQFDTALADFDALIMTQYQLVAAAGEVPATKLLGTTPKGFNSTGEYDESSYHETLESIQTHDLTPLIERHHLCVMRSVVVPRMRAVDKNFKPFQTFVDWAPLDSPTMKEYAEIEEIRSRTATNYANIGAVDQYDVRDSVINDKHSMFSGLAPAEPPADEPETPPANSESTNENTVQPAAEREDQPVKPLPTPSGQTDAAQNIPADAGMGNAPDDQGER